MSYATPIEAIFWASAGLVVMAYAGYPPIIWCLSRLFGRVSAPQALEDVQLPSVSLLVAAYNEEAVIDERVRNALATDYPPEKFKVVIASDGSRDATAEIVRRHSDPRLTLLDYTENHGKATVLNTVLPGLTGDIVLLSDANTYIEPGALRKLVRWFGDPRIGVVCGRLLLTDPKDGTNVDGMYWTYETFLKKCEGRLGALLGANGAIYAIRKDLFDPIPTNTTVDDFVIPLLAKMKSGCSIVYDGDAVAREETRPDMMSEFQRRCRFGASGFQNIVMFWKLADPRRGWIAFTFLCHKVLRWLCPLLLVAMLLTSAALIHRPLYAYLFVAQLAFYALSLLAIKLPTGLKPLKPLRLATMFTSMNVALLIGFSRWLRGAQGGTWNTRRPVVAAASSGGSEAQPA
jgi:cellulose synthase/poly-beta-1,6-N-acetylglucosamine synthase-like glycosyltransferase